MKRILPVLLLLGFSLLNAKSALACVCGGEPGKPRDEEIKADIAKEFNESAAVFSGEVIELDTFKVKFKVKKLWKGDPSEEVIMSTGAKMIDETHYRSSSCDYRYKVGEKYLIYARKTEENELVAYKCTRTNLLARSERDVAELDNLNPNAHRPPAPEAVSRLEWFSTTAESNSRPQPPRPDLFLINVVRLRFACALLSLGGAG